MKPKQIILWSAITLLVIAAGVAFARAEARRGWCHYAFGGPRAMRYIDHALDLNQSQRKQIRSMWQAEKPAISSLVAEFAAESKEMDAATKGGLDEAKVQEIAARQGATVSKLLVEKERFKSQVYATVLTPGQRIKADELQARWHERLSRMSNF